MISRRRALALCGTALMATAGSLRAAPLASGLYEMLDAEFAAIEGEGDGSLAYWLEGHRRYFEQECASAGRQFDERMLLACEKFKVIYRPRPSTA